MSLIQAVARNPRIPFSSCSSGFLRNTRRGIFPRCRGTTCCSESFPKPVSGFVHGLHGKRLQHVGHHAITRAIRIILHHLHTSPEYSVNSDLHPSRNPGLKAVCPSSLLLNPLLLHTRRLILVVMTSFAMGRHLLHPLISVFTGLSIDPEPFHTGSLNDLSLGQSSHPSVEFSSCFPCLVPEIFHQRSIPAFCRRRLLSDLIRNLEVVFVSARRPCSFNRRLLLQPFLQRHQPFPSWPLSTQARENSRHKTEALNFWVSSSDLGKPISFCLAPASIHFVQLSPQPDNWSQPLSLALFRYHVVNLRSHGAIM